jgi:hypothetical protein
MVTYNINKDGLPIQQQVVTVQDSDTGNKTANVCVILTLTCNRVSTVVENSIFSHFSVCVCVALFIQHAKRMRGIILSSMAFPVLLYFSKLS